MDGESLASAQALFRDIARIRRLQIEAKSEASVLPELLDLIETRTLNYRLREEVASAYGMPPNPEWSNKIRNELNATLCRSNDPLYLANTNVKLGRYVEALPFYSCPELATNLQVLQENWSFVITALERERQRQREAGAAHPLSNALLLNLALAYWCTNDWRSCAVTLLHLCLPLAKPTWLSEGDVRTMLFVSAGIALDAPTLRFFAKADPLAQHFGVAALVPSVCGDLAALRAAVATLEFPPYAGRDSALRALRARAGSVWLQLHSAVPLPTALAELGVASSDELVANLREWQLPYDVDLVHGEIHLRSPARRLALASAQMHAVGETLAAEYRRDALVRMWSEHRHGAP